MDRLASELQRLYLPQDAHAGGTRAMVLAVAGPGSWEALGPAWQGVQADLHLPAPGIAVSGRDGLELWFSLAQPARADEAAGFLQLLRRRYLAGLPEARVRLQVEGARDALPPRQLAPERWSAFVTPDLAALFADEPWLDLPPSPDAQAELLSRLRSIPLAELRRACAEPVPGAVTPASTATPAPHQDPRSFLLAVMNDPSVDLRLRIEAAKALLPHAGS